jgi:hypothetical protein
VDLLFVLYDTNISLSLQDSTLAENNTITYFCCSNGLKAMLVRTGLKISIAIYNYVILFIMHDLILNIKPERFLQISYFNLSVLIE